MINLEYHKGEVCSIKPTLCQEGYCGGCMIYLESLAQKPANPEIIRAYAKIDSFKELQYARTRDYCTF